MRMAGGWLKMRTSLRRNAKVIAMARFLDVQPKFVAWWFTPGDEGRRNENVTLRVTNTVTFSALTRVTVATLLEVWGSVRDVINSEHHVPCMTLDDINEVAAVPVFAEAMVEVGWVLEHPDEGGLIFPNFSEYNKLEHKREPKTGAERAREFRARKKERAAAAAAKTGEPAGDGGPGTSVTKRNENVTLLRGEERRGEEKEEQEGAASAAPALPAFAAGTVGDIDAFLGVVAKADSMADLQSLADDAHADGGLSPAARKRVGKAIAARGEHLLLLDVCRWWNTLHADGLVAAPVRTRQIAEGVQAGWKRVLRSPELREMLTDRDKLREAIETCKFRRSGWFRLANLLGGKNRAGEYYLRALLDGAYRDDDDDAKVPTIDTSTMDF